jgi:hypothetical protein
MHTICSSSSEKETRFTAVGNSHTKRHLPVCTDQSRISLSADPETRKRDCAAYKIRAEKEARRGKDRSRTIDIYRPDSPVVAIVCPETFAIVREPDVDDVIF